MRRILWDRIIFLWSWAYWCWRHRTIAPFNTGYIAPTTRRYQARMKRYFDAHPEIIAEILARAGR